MNQNDLLVTVLVILQLVSTNYLWGLDAASSVSQARFAIFLAIDLLSFAMIAYIYRKSEWRERTYRIWLLLGSFGLVLLLVSSLIFT
jgi:phosphoglycerol transferase MdoB-like AlkP superfamily enzyme